MMRFRMKKPLIYKSEHEPFLFGNIARRSVIGMISRKAISLLAALTLYRKPVPFFFPLKVFSPVHKQVSGVLRVPRKLPLTSWFIKCIGDSDTCLSFRCDYRPEFRLDKG